MKFNRIKSQSVRAADMADQSFAHLQAEIARIDVLIRKAVRQWQVAGQNPDDALRGLYVSPNNIDAIVTRRFGTNWSEGSVLPPDELAAFTAAYNNASAEVGAVKDAARQAGLSLRLLQLAQAFGLTEFDVDALLVCLAPALDLRYEQLYGFLQDDVTRRQPMVNLILDLLCEPTPERLHKIERFTSDAPLFKYHLLVPVTDSHNSQPHMLSQMLRVSEAVVMWLLGRYQSPAELGSQAILSQPVLSGADGLLLQEMQSSIENSIDDQALLVFYGVNQIGMRAAARFVASKLGRMLLTVNLAGSVTTEVSALQATRLALRDARMTGALLCLTDWDVTLSEDSPDAVLFSELCAHPDIVLITGTRLWQTRLVERDRNIIWLEFQLPGYAQREAIWQYYVGDRLQADKEPIDINGLAGQFVLGPSQIRDAVTNAVDVAKQKQEPLSNRLLFAAARAQSTPALGNLARKLNPRYTWTDIVLPIDQVEMLQELVKQVRGRPFVLEQWGLGKKLTASNGITVLFAGPPGTGKTMSAEVVASELGLDLYKIDLSTIVSKYIGETEKNLDRIFSEAESSNAILFFDEADAIFGKRSEVKDAHDRYANIEVSYLLQRMEGYNGVTVLATNLRANLDDAFTRRLQFAIDFPFPDEVYRLQIWETLFPPQVPVDKAVDFKIMAKRFRLAGGNIRNIIVSAAYLAASDGGVVTMSHLMHGARRELQKMGRLVNEKDLIVT